MRKLLLTTALIGGFLASTTAMAQDYDKKNVENLESQVGFSALNMESPIQEDNAEAPGGIMVKDQEATAIPTIQTDIIEVFEPAAPIVNIEGAGVISVEEQEITIIEPAMDENVDVIVETKTVIGNTDTGATAEDMAKALDKEMN